MLLCWPGKASFAPNLATVQKHHSACTPHSCLHPETSPHSPSENTCPGVAESCGAFQSLRTTTIIILDHSLATLTGTRALFQPVCCSILYRPLFLLPALKNLPCVYFPRQQTKSACWVYCLGNRSHPLAELANHEWAKRQASRGHAIHGLLCSHFPFELLDRRRPPPHRGVLLLVLQGQQGAWLPALFLLHHPSWILPNFCWLFWIPAPISGYVGWGWCALQSKTTGEHQGGGSCSSKNA